MSTDQIYRQIEPSDLPKIQKGELKAFYQGAVSGKYFPAKLISTRFGNAHETAFLVRGDDSDWIQMFSIVVDVTPEKRYAIWDHKKQRFLESLSDEAIRTEADKTAMEVWVQEYCTKYGFSNKDYYIVEWEIKNDV